MVQPMFVSVRKHQNQSLKKNYSVGSSILTQQNETLPMCSSLNVFKQIIISEIIIVCWKQPVMELSLLCALHWPKVTISFFLSLTVYTIYLRMHLLLVFLGKKINHYQYDVGDRIMFFFYIHFRLNIFIRKYW